MTKDTAASEAAAPIDQLDVLINQFRPIENLFRLMNRTGTDGEGGSLVTDCGEIGLSLAAQFRETMERLLKRT